jgi:hypothetical protein
MKRVDFSYMKNYSNSGYDNLRKLLGKYFYIDDMVWDKIKLKVSKKTFNSGDTIDTLDSIKDELTYINRGVAKAIQSNTQQIWYLYFNHENLSDKDLNHTILQDFFGYVYDKTQTVIVEAITECEIIYLKYKDLKDILGFEYSFQKFKDMISDFELERIDKQINDRMEVKYDKRLGDFLNGKFFLLGVIHYEIIREYLEYDIGQIFDVGHEFQKIKMSEL